MPESSSSHYLRFVGSEPSIFQFPNDPAAGIGDFIEALTPRPKDNGFLSVWHSDTETKDNYIIAGIAARRGKKDRISVLFFPDFLLKQAQIEPVFTPDPDTFACISSLHVGLSLAEISSRENLAQSFVQSMTCGTILKENVYVRINKSEVEDFLLRVYKLCKQKGNGVELGKAGSWAQQIVQKVDPPDVATFQSSPEGGGD